MRKLLITLCWVLLLSCNESDKAIPMVELEDKFSCDEYRIDNRDFYSFSVEHIFKMRIVDLTHAEYNLERLEQNINKRYEGTNISFDIRKYEEQSPSDTVNLREIFDKYFEIGYITMVVLSDSIVLETGNREGASNGIPELDNVSLGRPIFFVKKFTLYEPNLGVLIHELGHVFGLKHLFEGYDMTNKGLNCETGDNIPDVVTLPRQGSVSSRTCSYYAPEKYIENYTKEEIDEATINYMSYSPPKCLRRFSDAQIERQRKMIEVNPLLQYAKAKVNTGE